MRWPPCAAEVAAGRDRIGGRRRSPRSRRCLSSGPVRHLPRPGTLSGPPSSARSNSPCISRSQRPIRALAHPFAPGGPERARRPGSAASRRGPRQRGRILQGHHDPGLAHRLRIAGAVGDHQRQAPAHGLEHGQREPLALRGHHEDVARGDQPWYVRAVAEDAQRGVGEALEPSRSGPSPATRSTAARRSSGPQRPPQPAACAARAGRRRAPRRRPRPARARAGRPRAPRGRSPRAARSRSGPGGGSRLRRACTPAQLLHLGLGGADVTTVRTKARLIARRTSTPAPPSVRRSRWSPWVSTTAGRRKSRPAVSMAAVSPITWTRSAP